MIFAVFDIDAGVPADIFADMIEAANIQLGYVCKAWSYVLDVVVDGKACGYDANQMNFGKDFEIAPIFIFKNPDTAGALGYHDKDPQGRAYGKVFTEPSLSNGGSYLDGPYAVSVTLTHEIPELRGDYNARGWVQMDDGRLTAEELCDAVEDTFFTVKVCSGKDVSVSNFLLPDWSDTGSIGPYDYLKILTAPFTMTPGSYWLILDASSLEIEQEFGMKMPEWKVKQKLLSHRLAMRRAER